MVPNTHRLKEHRRRVPEDHLPFEAQIPMLETASDLVTDEL